jgi:hypothetical protein
MARWAHIFVMWCRRLVQLLLPASLLRGLWYCFLIPLSAGGFFHCLLCKQLILFTSSLFSIEVVVTSTCTIIYYLRSRRYIYGMLVSRALSCCPATTCTRGSTVQESSNEAPTSCVESTGGPEATRLHLVQLSFVLAMACGSYNLRNPAVKRILQVDACSIVTEARLKVSDWAS